MAMGHDGLPSGPEAGGRHSLPMPKVEGAEGFLILPIARRPLFVGRRAFCGMHWPRALAIRPSSVYILRTYCVHIDIVRDPSGTRNLASIRAAVAAGPDHPPTGQGPYQRRPRLRAVTLDAGRSPNRPHPFTHRGHDETPMLLQAVGTSNWPVHALVLLFGASAATSRLDSSETQCTTQPAVAAIAPAATPPPPPPTGPGFGGV